MKTKIDILQRLFFLITAAAVVWGLYLAARAPGEATQGDAAKLLFVHVPAAITAYLALGVGLLAALWYLIRRSPAADRMSSSAIEVGVIFTVVTLVSGMIWGRAVWGLWWDWNDARLMSTAIMFFYYMGYLALRRSIIDPEARAGRCAVLAVIGFIQIPIVHYSVLWFRTLHQGPTILRPDGFRSTMDEEFALSLAVGIMAFVAAMTLMLTSRLTLSRLQDARNDLSGLGPPVGRGVTAPFMGGPTMGGPTMGGPNG